eukprot:TRINITY_DN1278_c0_g1_i11.p1 TRINITY_DN1278_c0_g1~~TRINITY_DN1278_c0_g1_i11.p1  ORF type:complete len:315 (+),score=48.47 TRINITY_DN1278_c0_g1_i11:104-946(+)
MLRSLVGSEMCIRDRLISDVDLVIHDIDLLVLLNPRAHVLADPPLMPSGCSKSQATNRHTDSKSKHSTATGSNTDKPARRQCHDQVNQCHDKVSQCHDCIPGLKKPSSQADWPTLREAMGALGRQGGNDGKAASSDVQPVSPDRQLGGNGGRWTDRSARRLKQQASPNPNLDPNPNPQGGAVFEQEDALETLPGSPHWNGSVRPADDQPDAVTSKYKRAKFKKEMERILSKPGLLEGKVMVKRQRLAASQESTRQFKGVGRCKPRECSVLLRAPRAGMVV